jgi:hypothetical protein
MQQLGDPREQRAAIACAVIALSKRNQSASIYCHLLAHLRKFIQRNAQTKQWVRKAM